MAPNSAVPAAKYHLSLEEPPCRPRKRFHCLNPRSPVTTNRTHSRHHHESFPITGWSNLLKNTNKNQNLSSLTLILPRMWGPHPPLCGVVLTEARRQVASGHLLNMYLVLGTVACKSEATVFSCVRAAVGER